MSVSRTQKLKILNRRQQVMALRLKEWSQAEIAAELGVSQATVSGDLKQIEKEWRASSIRDFDLACAVELKKIDQLERAAWEGYEQSKKPAQSAVMHGDAGSSPARKTVKNRYGDPRFLDQVHKCMAARRALLGLDAPKRVESQESPDKPLTIASLLNMVTKAGPVSTTPPTNVIDVEAECRKLLEEYEQQGTGGMEAGQAPAEPAKPVLS